MLCKAQLLQSFLWHFRSRFREVNQVPDSFQRIVDFVRNRRRQTRGRSQLLRLAKNFLRLPMIGCIAKHQDNSDQIALVIKNRGSAVLDRSQRAVSVLQHGMVRQPHNLSLLQYLLHRVLARLVGVLMEDREDFRDRLAFGLCVSLFRSAELPRDSQT